MAQIHKNKDGYIDGFATVGGIVGGIDVESIPQEVQDNCTAYKYTNNKFVLDTDKLADQQAQQNQTEAKQPSQIEKIQAQLDYTAMMTDTVMEV